MRIIYKHFPGKLRRMVSRRPQNYKKPVVLGQASAINSDKRTLTLPQQFYSTKERARRCE